MKPFFVTYYQTPIGTVKITSDESAVTELVFVDEKEVSSPEQNELPPVLSECTRQLDEFFAGSRTGFDVPVTQAGTVFQQKVWRELLEIPFGKTVSYLSLSKRLGDAKAIRAVAASNGKNKVSILVPCHRVVGSDQSLVGYAWGAWRKQWLLAHEAKWANGVQTLF